MDTSEGKEHSEATTAEKRQPASKGTAKKAPRSAVSAPRDGNNGDGKVDDVNDGEAGDSVTKSKGKSKAGKKATKKAASTVAARKRDAAAAPGSSVARKGPGSKGPGGKKAPGKRPKPNAPGTADPVKRRRRFRPGTVALREIRRFQKGTEHLLRRLPFTRLVRELGSLYREDLRFQRSALDAMQDASEAHLIGMLEKINRAAIHARRVTIMPKDARHILAVTTPHQAHTHDNIYIPTQ